MNILEHEFELYLENKLVKSYRCNICKCDIDYFKDTNEILLWDKISCNFISLITCEEYIIKSIIE